MVITPKKALLDPLGRPVQNPPERLGHSGVVDIANDRFNVAGLMPLSDRDTKPFPGSADGKWIFQSMIEALDEAQRLTARSRADPDSDIEY